MAHDKSIGEMRVKDLVEAIRENRPAPGAGAAGAVVLALAAACAEKAVAISLRHNPEEKKLAAAKEGFEEIARRALSNADADAEDFSAFMRSRNASMAERLVQTDKRIVDLGSALIALVEDVEASVAANMAGDLFAARALAKAARDIESHNIAETVHDSAKDSH